MRGFFTLFLFLTLAIWYALSGYWYVCKIKNKCATTVVKKEPIEKTSKPPVVKAESVKAKPVNTIPFNIAGMPFENTTGENIYFANNDKNAAYPVIPVSLKNQFPQIADYLGKNKEKAIEIAGSYTSKDIKPQKYDNLGIARAENVKLELLKLGLNKKQIITKGTRTSSIPEFGNQLTGVITAKITNKPTEIKEAPPVDLKAIEEKLNAVAKTVYFETNSSRIIETLDLNQYVKDLKVYLQSDKSQKINVTGHTDNIGNPIKNTELGLKRAIYVKEFLIRKGINQNQVVAASKGSEQPIAKNSTIDGRKRNRRVEISLIKN